MSFYEKILYDARNLLEDKNFEAAKTVLLKGTTKKAPKQSPFVENNTLYYYGEGSSALMHLLNDAYFQSRIHMPDDSIKNDHLMDKELVNLYKKTPWKNSAVIAPYYPSIYLHLGIVSVELNHYDQAINYLDTALFIWNGNANAWSELMYCYQSKLDYQKVKELGKRALSIDEVRINDKGHASILRKLGFIAIEEGKLEKAKKYFEDSIQLHDHPMAHAELKYIKQVKEEMKK